MDAKLEATRKKGRHGDTILAHISPKEALALTLSGGAGTINPKTGLPEFFGWSDLNPFKASGGGIVGSLLTGGLSDLYAGYQKWQKPGGSFYDLIDRSIDPGGLVDASIRGVGGTKFGEALSPVVKVAGPVVGGIVGGAYGGPLGAAGGAAAGSGFASKWEGLLSNEEAIKRAGITGVIAGALGYGGKALGGMGSGAQPGAEPLMATEAAAAGAPTGAGLTSAEMASLAAPAAEAGAGANSLVATAPLFEGAAPTALEAAAQTTNPNLAAILADMGTKSQANAAIAAGSGAGAGALTAPGGGPAPAAPTFTPAELALDRSGASFTSGLEGMGSPPTKSFIMPGTEKAGGYLDKTGGWMKANPIKSMLAANALSSVLQSGMMGGVNQAQQESYGNYLSAINPPDAVKRARYGALAENARTMGTLTQRKIDESLAARGVRGKGKAAPTGDVEEAKRKSLNDAYNMIFGQHNVPGAPGPVNYAPSAGQLAGTSTAQMAAQGLPLWMLMSKYGVTGQGG